MLFDGVLLGRASGSVGGITAAHNRGGQYLRQRSTPVNPNSTQQQAIRSAMSQLAAIWSDVLDDAERASWDLYAANVLLPNRLGVPVNVGGVGMFMRTNVPILTTLGGGGAVLKTAPAVFNLGEYTSPSITAISASTDQITLAFENADDWANEDDAAMLIYASRPQGPAINFFKGPYRFADTIDGDSVTPPTSPATINLPFQAEEGQKVFVRVNVIRADGRLSASFRGGKVVGV